MFFDPFDNIVHEVGLLLGKPDDQMRLLLILLGSYPIGYVFRFLRGRNLRHFYSIFLGVILHLFMFRDGVVHFWGLGIVVYLILTVMKKKSLPWVVFIVCLTHLSAMHLYRMLFDFGNWSLDATTFLMPLISRLSSLGFVYSDGSKDEKDLTEEQKERRIVDKPSIVEMLSYISFPVAGMCGPFFEFRDFRDFMEEKGRYKHIPSSSSFVWKKMLEGVIVLALAVKLPTICDPYELESDWFFDMPYLHQYVYWMIAWFAYRTTYFVAWVINDGGLALSGLSYSGTTPQGQPKFDRIVSVNIIQLEACTVPREGVRHWNSMTAEWLRHYVYERVRPRNGGDATMATMGTNLVSAFWHGFYPTYYNTFFFLAIIAEIGKDVYRLRHLFSFIPGPISAVIRNLLIMTSLNYFATGMILLEFKKAMKYYAKYNFFWHLMILGTFVVFRFALLPTFKKRSKKDNGTKGEDKSEKAKLKKE